MERPGLGGEGRIGSKLFVCIERIKCTTGLKDNHSTIINVNMKKIIFLQTNIW